MSKTVGIGVLVEDTGETARTLQHWSDLGILQPLSETHKQGRGYYRQFPVAAPFHGERTWALIASALNDLRIPLGDIKTFIERFRRITGHVEGLAPKQQAISLETTPIGRALAGRFEVILLALNEKREIGWTSILSEESPEAVKESYTIKMGEIGNAEDIEVFERVKLSAPWDFLANHPSGYVLNLTRILEPLRTAK